MLFHLVYFCLFFQLDTSDESVTDSINTTTAVPTTTTTTTQAKTSTGPQITATTSTTTPPNDNILMVSIKGNTTLQLPDNSLELTAEVNDSSLENESKPGSVLIDY